VKNAWKALVETKQVPPDVFIAELNKTGRDHSRTPMQWDATANAGFTTASKPWLAVNPNYLEINAAHELSDKGSIYHYFRAMTDVRRSSPAFVYGDYKDLDPSNASVYAYTRSIGKSGYLVVLNFTTDAVTYKLPTGMKLGELVISNLAKPGDQGDTLSLKPWEARVYKY